MPNFSAIALDMLLEREASKSVDMSVPSSRLKPLKQLNPAPNPKLERRNSTFTAERKIPQLQITPALYATPKVTPLPDSPTSFSPSPYVINHKRRGPRILRSSSEPNVYSKEKNQNLEHEEVQEKAKNVDAIVSNPSNNVSDFSTVPESLHEHVNMVHDCKPSSYKSEDVNLENGNTELGKHSIHKGIPKENESSSAIAWSPRRDEESEDFFDPLESISFTSNTDGEDNAGKQLSVRVTSSGGEFFDTWEELSSDSGTRTSQYNVEAELQELRLSLMMEIEKRKQADETLCKLRMQWEKIRYQLSIVGLSFPANSTSSIGIDDPNFNTAEELCQQVQVAKFVSEIIGRGTAKAVAEMEMEAQIESKNFEIARSLDRLKYYETVIQEMSQRNQESVEMARRERQRRKRKQKWIWGSIATAIALGTATIAWSYLPAGKGSLSDGHWQVPDRDKADN